MKSVLIHLRPFDKAANVRRDIYVGDGPSGETYGAGGFVWEPALVTRPQMSIELFNLEMDGSVQTGRAQFVIAIDAITAVANPRDLYWKGALVTIHFDASVEGNGNEADFAGYATQASLDVDSGRLTISAEVSSVLLERPVLTRTFTGGGGVGGDAGKRGEFLPAGFGAVKNIEPVWFDLTRNIGMIDGYDNTISIDWLGEGLNSFGARVADYASYDALAAAIDAKVIAPGQWGTCVVKGLVGLGAPPVSPITVHATFGCNRAGTLIRRLAIFHAGVADALVDAVACAQLDADVNRPVHYWTKDQRQVKDLIEAIARACNASPLISFQGRLTVTRAVTSNPVATIDLRGGSEPRVIRWRQGQPDPPFFQIRARAARPARVLTTDEVNYVDTLVDRGLYAGGESYRAGNIVWLEDGSQWLYINAAPSTGNYPAAGAYWQQMQPPKTASDFRYSTGETINALRPQEAGANKTETRSAASIAGQGALATQSSATWQSQVTGAGKPTDNADVTLINTAAAIVGQGALATQSSLAYGSGYLTGFGGLAAQTGVRMGGPSGSYAGIANEPGSFWITDAGYQTVQGTAAAIAGQGALATQSDINYDNQIGFMPAALLRSSLYDGNYLSADYSYYSGGVVMSALRPQESGANKTETRSAASISGQGALATKSRADWYLDVAERPEWATGTIDIGGVEVLQAGYVYRGGGDNRNMYDYFPQTTLSDRTGAASAASISGQGALATQSALNLDTQAYGQIPDGRNLNASNNFGLRALSSPPVLGDTVIDGQLYLSIGGSTFYGDWGGAVSYPSAVIGPGPFGLTYYIWRNVTGPSDPGSSYDASPELVQALGADKVYIGYVTARASAGAGPGTGGGSGNPPPGGGGGGGVNLV